MSMSRDNYSFFVNLLTSVINDSSISILFTIIATSSISCIVRIGTIFGPMMMSVTMSVIPDMIMTMSVTMMMTMSVVVVTVVVMRNMVVRATAFPAAVGIVEWLKLFLKPIYPIFKLNKFRLIIKSNFQVPVLPPWKM